MGPRSSVGKLRMAEEGEVASRTLRWVRRSRRSRVAEEGEVAFRRLSMGPRCAVVMSWLTEEGEVASRRLSVGTQTDGCPQLLTLARTNLSQ